MPPKPLVRACCPIPGVQVPGCRKELQCGGSHLTIYSRQQRADKCHFREARLEAAARIARMPVLPELLAMMRDKVNEHRSCREVHSVDASFKV